MSRYSRVCLHVQFVIMASSDEEDFAIDSTQPELLEKRSRNNKASLLEKSKEKYEVVYENFMQWSKNDKTLSEKNILEYFQELSQKYKPISLWSIYSMLKGRILLKHGIDIKKYTKVAGLIKQLNAGYVSFKTPSLPAEGIEKFLKEACDNNYLSIKVVLIFAITGIFGSKQLAHIKVQDIEQQGEVLLVNFDDLKTKNPRAFVIHGEYYEIVKQYQALRPKNANNDRFFLTYHSGKCTTQPIGSNTFGGMPKKIAEYLKLPNPESYTGHSFKQTYYAMHCGSSRGFKRKSTTEINHLSPSRELQSQHQSTSNMSNFMCLSANENSMSPIHVDVDLNPGSRPSSPCENGDGETFTHTFHTPGKNATYNFSNCRFSYCFNK